MFRTNKIAEIAQRVIKNQFSSKKTETVVPTAYSGAVQALHWSMGGAMAACVGKSIFC